MKLDDVQLTLTKTVGWTKKHTHNVDKKPPHLCLKEAFDSSESLHFTSLICLLRTAIDALCEIVPAGEAVQQEVHTTNVCCDLHVERSQTDLRMAVCPQRTHTRESVSKK